MRSAARYCACALLVSIVFVPFAVHADVPAVGPGQPGFDADRPAIPPESPPGHGLVYDNTAFPLKFYLGGFGGYDMAADEVNLGLAPGLFSSLTLWYVATGLEGDETVTVSIHRMDSAPTPASFGFNTPGSVLYTATLPISEGVAAATFIDPAPSILLPGTVAVSLQFRGWDLGDPDTDAGPLLADPPTVGSSLDDYWLTGFPPGEPWGLRTSGVDFPLNFAMSLTTASAIPESPSLGLLGLGLVGLGLGLSRRRRAGADAQAPGQRDRA